MNIAEKIKLRFDFIYKGDYSSEIINDLTATIQKVKNDIEFPNQKWDEKDVVLITYGDSILSENSAPLITLAGFLKKYIRDAISFVHILPFFPYSSDDGFSVIDYQEVNPELGTWGDVQEIKKDYKLMFDLVINHVSQNSKWYQNYLKGEDPGAKFFIEASPEYDLSNVVRPRSLPLLTPAQTVNGLKYVWTTFSEDQIDLNFSEPELMAEMIKVFLFYLEQGASMIRLDAIAFLWKKIGTTCLHLPETHEFVKLLRDITDYLSEGLILLTETNVPNKENLSYFGENDEANMVYQFSLPPLLLHALFNGNSEYLNKWASDLPELSDKNTFFNFTASHDGVGVRPLEGLVPEKELLNLVEGMKSFGGKVNTRRNKDGSDSPYELNIAYFDALKGTKNGVDKLQEARFICSQTVMMSMAGVPAFYIHSLLATNNYYKGVEETGMNRTINRRKWKEEDLFSLLDSESHHGRVLKELLRRISIRKLLSDFHPSARQQIINLSESLFILNRGDNLLAIFNITDTNQEIDIKGLFKPDSFIDLITETRYSNYTGKLQLTPYQAMWLKQEK